MISILLYALLGWLAGVLVNRAADNLPPPERRSIFLAPRCGYCGAERRAAEQSGLLSFLFFGGRCSSCRAPCRLRSPVVEFVSVLLFIFLWQRLGSGLPVLVLSIFTVILLLITVIDLEHRLILDMVSLPATALALVLAPLFVFSSPTPDTWLNALLRYSLPGAIVGYLLVFAIYLFGILFSRLMALRRGRPIDEVAFGFGDVKLAGLVGALTGVPGILYVLIYGILLGGVSSLAVILFHFLLRRRYSAYTAIPYGPFFTIVAWVLLVLSI